jgi:D-alanine-D-alanine ligase
MSIGPSKLIRKTLQEHYTNVGISVVNNLSDLERLVAKKPDLCFLGLKQVPIEDNSDNMIWVSDYLDSKGINYTGSSSKAIALDFDKNKAKDVVLAAGLNTSKYFIGTNQYKNADEIPINFPLFIKPSNLGNKQGIDKNSVVHNFTSYVNKLQEISTIYGSESIVENYLSGREFSVGVMEDMNSNNLMVFPIEAIIEKNERGDRILGNTNNSAEAEQILKVNNNKIFKEICKLAKDVFLALGARDYGRIDIRLDSNGIANFLEANLVPGLSDVSYFPISNNINNSKDYSTTIFDITQLAFRRT